ncbi:hypothetical protein D3C85_1084000 [compost metagenome]
MPHLLQMTPAILDHAVPAFETQAQDAVQDLEHVDVGLRIGSHPADQEKDLLTAVVLAFEGNQQAVARPGATAAPSRAVGGLVKRCAEAVTHRRHVRPMEVGTLAKGLETVHFARQQEPQRADLLLRRHRRRHVGQHPQQRASRFHERIPGDPHRLEPSFHVHWWIEREQHIGFRWRHGLARDRHLRARWRLYVRHAGLGEKREIVRRFKVPGAHL